MCNSTASRCTLKKIPTCIQKPQTRWKQTEPKTSDCLQQQQQSPRPPMCFFSNVASYILCQICPHPLGGSLRVNSEFNGCCTFQNKWRQCQQRTRKAVERSKPPVRNSPQINRVSGNVDNIMSSDERLILGKKRLSCSLAGTEGLATFCGKTRALNFKTFGGEHSLFGKKWSHSAFYWGFERRSLFRSRGTKSFATDDECSEWQWVDTLPSCKPKITSDKQRTKRTLRWTSWPMFVLF